MGTRVPCDGYHELQGAGKVLAKAWLSCSLVGTVMAWGAALLHHHHHSQGWCSEPDSNPEGAKARVPMSAPSSSAQGQAVS